MIFPFKFLYYFDEALQSKGVFPRVSRKPAAEKLTGTLQLILANPQCASNWSDLLLFTFSCFGIPGQRRGKRHLSSLASKVNQVIATL